LRQWLEDSANGRGSCFVIVVLDEVVAEIVAVVELLAVSDVVLVEEAAEIWPIAKVLVVDARGPFSTKLWVTIPTNNALTQHLPFLYL